MKSWKIARVCLSTCAPGRVGPVCCYWNRYGCAAIGIATGRSGWGRCAAIGIATGRSVWGRCAAIGIATGRSVTTRHKDSPSRSPIGSKC